jgi:hypothetical protein
MKDNSDFKFPKVLIAAPQHDSKKYCWDIWKERVKNLTYPNYDVYIAENSETDDFAKEIKEEGFYVERVGQNIESVLDRTTKAHEACRQYAVTYGYDFMLHLETDVIPPFDVIERLLASKKKVISATYDIHHGKMRQAMIQTSEPLDRFHGAYRCVPFIEHEEPLFFDGTVKQVYHAGIGCILISRYVFEKIKFRVDLKDIFHADTWFANDCFHRDIPIFVDTTIQCKHHNGTWIDQMDEILKPMIEN